MKVQLYIIRCKEIWKAYWTIAIQADIYYWRAVQSGHEALAGGDSFSGAAAKVGEVFSSIYLWKPQLPLGIAVDAVERWRARSKNRRMSDHEAMRLLVRQAAVCSGEEGIRAAGSIESIELGVSSTRDSTMISEEAVRAIAARLNGRAALLGEAQQLLAAGPPICRAAAGDWSALSAALQLAALRGQLRLRTAVAASQPAASPLRRLLPAPLRRGGRRCLRCGSGEERMNRTACEACGSSACAYCEACLTMGRSRECGLLILGGGMEGLAYAHRAAVPKAAQPSAAARGRGGRVPAAPDARWGLSPAQHAAASAALQYALPRLQLTATQASARINTPFLLWAVTGAGKTEMVFPLIEAALASGGRALVATPRRDVVLELDPRIRRAFPEARVVTLYGGSEQRWDEGEIMLATTHQLFRFHEYFQLVIVDELDAFPYHGDLRLQYAAAKASVPGGAVILLTATPSRALQLAARRKKLEYVRVPVRYHRYPLPVPIYVRIPQVAKLIAQRRVPSSLLLRLRASIERGAQCFVFVQQIRHAEPTASLLRAALPGVPIGATSSKDEDRSHHVQSFRERQLRVLVTTTILERGVTVTHSDVFILDADGRLFDEASLVQMAGRAGRSKDDPDGRVYFCAPVRSLSQLSAIKQIKSMNREAKAKGFLFSKLQPVNEVSSD
ncbi:helicase-related protein [Paenibacillus xylaniclasticus]|uniref:helicase-related protein n=1 Tax=Paenibacillus xylaniclasticus TaxID=588083 RepID=UPI000FD7F69D|nr:MULTISPECIES: helicase-related protein [Paenibacillus]GFN32663.1 hypothetical protein PCURB6_29230 [Paenibacillus curdlanolyticus]